MPTQPEVLIKVAEPTGNDSGIRAYNLEQIAQMPLPEYLRKDNKILYWRNQVFHDTAIIAPGVAITPQHIKRLFVKGKNESDTVMNSGAAIAQKGEFMTNMETNGEFPHDSTAICYSIEVDWQFTTAQPSAISLGQIQNASTAAVANYSASVCNAAIRRQFQLRLVRGEQSKHKGFLYEFPTRFGSTGAFGGTDGFIQNNSFASDTFSKLDRPEVFEGDSRFSFELVPLADTLTMPVWTIITVMIVCRYIGPFIV